jgi:hypothetical protein
VLSCILNLPHRSNDGLIDEKIEKHEWIIYKNNGRLTEIISDKRKVLEKAKDCFQQAKNSFQVQNLKLAKNMCIQAADYLPQHTSIANLHRSVNEDVQLVTYAKSYISSFPDQENESVKEVINLVTLIDKSGILFSTE